MFRSIIDEEIKIVLKKRKVIAQSKVIKKKKVHINFMRLNSTKLMHLKKIVTCVVFLRFIYTIICSTMNVMIEKIKIKAMFDNDAEINCMSKKLINAAQLFIRQSISIIMINATDERARFFEICEAVFINIKSIIVLISIFVMKRSDHEFFLERSFQRVVLMSFVNMNNEFLKMMLHSLNNEKRINFLKISVEHVNNKKKDLKNFYICREFFKHLNDDLINAFAQKIKSNRCKFSKIKVNFF